MNAPFHLTDALKVVENAKMRDYQADAALGDDYQRQKTQYQRWRDNQISENERVYMEGQRTINDVSFWSHPGCSRNPT